MSEELIERLKRAKEIPGFMVDGKPAYLMQLEEAHALLAEMDALRARAAGAVLALPVKPLGTGPMPKMDDLERTIRLSERMTIATAIRLLTEKQNGA